MRILAA